MEITQNDFQTDIKLAEGEALPSNYADIEECNISLDLKLSEDEVKKLNNGIQLKYKLKDLPAIGSAAVSITIDREATYGGK